LRAVTYARSAFKIKIMKLKSIIKHAFLLCFAVLATTAFGQEDFRKNAPKPGPAPKIEMGKAYQTTLANGLKVIAVENHKLPRVSFQVFVDVPPHNEGDKAGVASLAGQLLKRGTETKTKAEIDEAVDFIGGSLNSSASGLSGSSLTRHKETLLELMADVLLNPTFPAAEFDKIKKTTLSGLQSEKDDPNAILGKVSNVMRYGKDHPYGEIETEETVNNIKVEDLQKYYVDYFKPNLSYLIVVGDITPAEVDVIANKYFLRWSKGPIKTPSFEAIEMPKETTVDFVNKTGAVQSAISVTYPINMAPGAPDAIKASVMSTMFGGFFGSRLNANIREDKGFSYGVRARLSSDPLIGSFSAGGSVRNEVTDSTLVEFIKEMNRMRDELLTDDEFNMVKSVMSGNFARRLESPQTVARYALNIARYNLPDDYYASYLKKLNAVTKEDIQAMAKKYIRPENAHIVVVGNQDEVAENLAQFAKSGKVSFYNNIGNPISDSGKDLPEGITAETVISDYLQAIGGKEALGQVNTMQSVMTSNIQGMTMKSNMYQKSPTMSAMEVEMNGQVMQKMVYDGEKGAMIAMGQKQEMPKKMLDRYAVGYIFPELFYTKVGVKMELAGLETINGEDAYKLNIEFPNGQKQTDFYSQKTGFKVQNITVEQGQTQITSFSDFKEVEGIMLPHKVTVTGAMPFPLEMNMESVKVNEDIDSAKFKVE